MQAIFDLRLPFGLSGKPDRNLWQAFQFLAFVWIPCRRPLQ
ncbi:MAG TPA: hypothetical protein V6D28_29500 [Leptolyngbyaceae cyanobacterium]